jgi:hypothetical protein
MEKNGSSLEPLNVATAANESALLHFLLPIGAVAFAPFLLLELVAAVVSNAILLALVILACVKKLNNNINIYLFSLAVGGLIGAIDIFCLLSLVVARRWVLDFTFCNITRFIINIYYILFFLIYFIISRDKLKAVKDPLHGRPTNKRAYINSALIWVVSMVAGLILYAPWIWAGIQFNDIFLEAGNFICFGLTSLRVDSRIGIIITSLFVVTFWVISSIIIVITFSNFVRISMELRELKKIRQHLTNESNQISTPVGINGHDKPLYRTGEVRTAKSLTLIYFIQFSCVFISLGMSYIQIIRNSVLPPDNRDSPDFQIYFVVLLIIQFFPCISPIFLILSNKRLRTRVKELFKCTISPEVEASPVHDLTFKPPPRATSIFFHQKTNKITPLTKEN